MKAYNFRPFVDGQQPMRLHPEVLSGSRYSNSELPSPTQRVNMRMTISDDLRLNDYDQTLTLSGLFFIKYVDQRQAKRHFPGLIVSLLCIIYSP